MPQTGCYCENLKTTCRTFQYIPQFCLRYCTMECIYCKVYTRYKYFFLIWPSVLLLFSPSFVLWLAYNVSLQSMSALFPLPDCGFFHFCQPYPINLVLFSFMDYHTAKISNSKLLYTTTISRSYHTEVFEKWKIMEKF